MSLQLSNPNAVRLFKADGTELMPADYTTYIGSNGYLAGLQYGDADIYIQGIAAQSDEAISITYVTCARYGVFLHRRPYGRRGLDFHQ